MNKIGFRGGPFAGAPFKTNKSCILVDEYDTSHLAMTYTALLIHVILGDDLSRIDRNLIIASLAQLQHADGRFLCILIS